MIAETLNNVGVELMGDRPAHEFAGWTLDNTRTNCKAMNVLAEKCPRWVNVGCFAHCLALSMKDFCTHKKTKGRFSREYGVLWIKASNDACNMLANYLSDSLPSKKIVQRFQEEVYGRTKQIVVSVPTRFATNLFVMKCVLENKAAILQALSDSSWEQLGGKKPREVKELFLANETLWVQIEASCRFLQPFSDLIHQIEADRPALGRCYEGLCMLDSHVKACCQKFALVEATKSSLDTLIATWNRRKEPGTEGSDVQPLLSPAHVAAYMLDLLFTSCKEGDPQLPTVNTVHENMAKCLIQRVGGQAAVEQFMKLVLEGRAGPLKDAVKACALSKVSENRKRAPVPSILMRKGVWKRYGNDFCSELAQIAVRLMSVHPTSCAAERNWSRWGKVYASSRNALGADRAQKMIAYSCNNNAQNASMDDLSLDLAVVQGDDDLISEHEECDDIIDMDASE
jgi:hypothetical protein